MTARHLLVIVPAFNEAGAIRDVVASLCQRNHDVLVIDDCSSDLTADIASGAGATVLRLPLNLGVGGALRAGFRYAVANGYSQVVQVDADGQHPVHQISDLVETARTHRAHLVIGSRYLSPDSTLIPSLPRRFSMWCLSAVASRTAGMRLTDTTSGFRLIAEPLLSQFAETFPDYYLGDTFEATVAAARAGYRIVEIPASLSPRLVGKSSSTSVQASMLIAKVLIISLTKLHYQLKSLEVKS